MNNDLKEKTVFVRFDADTKKVIKSLADEKGMTVSGYCRMILLEKIKTNKGEEL